jgi:hypothetical protein
LTNMEMSHGLDIRGLQNLWTLIIANKIYGH